MKISKIEKLKTNYKRRCPYCNGKIPNEFIESNNGDLIPIKIFGISQGNMMPYYYHNICLERNLKEILKIIEKDMVYNNNSSQREEK